jgi:predicted dehydrogenase
VDGLIRTVVIGTGFIGMAHVEALRRCGVEVVGLLGSSPERARPKAEAAGVPHVYADLTEVLDDPKVDVVHVASPNDAHTEQATAVLAAGKHVVCEKPLGLRSEETAGLVERARSSGLVHAVCLNVRFYPLAHQMRAMIRAGDIGSPRFVTGSYLQDWLLRDTDWNWRLVPDRAGELRAVADIGSHWLDLAQFVTGTPITEVMADLHTFVPVRRHPEGPVETFAAVDAADGLIEEAMDSDDGAGILLRFEGGARGTLAISQVAAGRKNSVSIEVDGSEQATAWYSEDPDRLWVGHRGRPNEVLAREPGALAPAAAAVTQYPGGHVEGYPDTFRGLFSRVYDDVRRGEPSPEPDYPTFVDGHDVLLVTEAIARSSREGRWTRVDR